MIAFRGKTLQGLLSIALALVCILCYALLLILFLKPGLYNIESLINPDRTNIKPTVAVSLVALILTSATVTLVTRCVEHSLWISLAKEPKDKDSTSLLTVGEARRLAQWSTSALERLMYVVGAVTGPDKRSWLLRVSGPLLLATATVGPVLLIGISESSNIVTTTETVLRSADPWRARWDDGNRRYRGGKSFDNPTYIAAMAAMRNLSAPVAPLCQDTDARSSCSVSAKTVAIQASCRGASRSNPDKEGVISISGVKNSTFCSGENTARELCVQLQSGSPATYSMFASGPAACASNDIADCPEMGVAGRWAKLFGVWVNGVDITADPDYRLNFIDCDLTYGNITVKQNGTSPPFLDRSSYIQSNTTESNDFGDSQLSITELNRIYTELGNSPYDWKLAAVGTGFNTLYSTPIAYLLLGHDANNDAETVARQIESNFEMATLHSFARGSNASDLLFTRTHSYPIYVYNQRVLLILLVPFIATILGSWRRWKIAGEATSIGYDPVGIARLGPVTGLGHGPPLTNGQKRYENSFKVWRWTRETIDQEHRPTLVTGMQAFDPRTIINYEQGGVVSK